MSTEEGRRLRVGWFTPLPPARSGIADYSEEFLPELARHVDLEVFHPGGTPTGSVAATLPCRPVAEAERVEAERPLDVRVYQLGNHPDHHGALLEEFFRRPGVAEFHDLSLHGLIAGTTFVRGDAAGYLQAVRASHGEPGAQAAKAFLEGRAPPPWESRMMEMTVNRPVAERATGLVAHSDLALQSLKALAPGVPALKLLQHTNDVADDPAAFRADCRRRLGLPDGTLVLGSFGFATPPKRIDRVLEALGRLRAEKPVDLLYAVVGQAEGFDLEGAVRANGLGDCVRIVGFAAKPEFLDWMGACDACFNLRWPTAGESSGTLHRMFGLGKLAVVTRGGTFDEYPDALVRRVRHGDGEVEDLLAVLRALRDGRIDLAAVARRAVRFAREEGSLARNAARLAAFLGAVAEGRRWPEEPADRLVDRLAALALAEDRYVAHLAPKAAAALGEEPS